MDTRESDWRGWAKNTPAHIGWRQQSRAGTGYRVFGLCEAIRKPDTAEDITTGDTASDRKHTEFWLFSPPIHLGQVLSVHTQIYFMLRSCSDRELSSNLQRCREHFDLFLQQEGPNTPVETDQNFVPDEKVFKKLTTVSPDTKWRADTSASDAVTSWLIRFRPSVSNGWIRLAIRDEGACVMLDRIHIYYLSCPAWQVGFMRLPETAAGHDAEVREVVGTCVPGARPIMTSFSPSAFRENSSFHFRTTAEEEGRNSSRPLKSSFCMANGKWHAQEEDSCECLPGYEASEELSTCSSCPRSTYKSFAGLGLCQLCPVNSKADAAASDKAQMSGRPVVRRQCECNEGYFWMQEEGIEFGICTQTLPVANNLQILELKHGKVTLGWDTWITEEPIFYSVQCLNCVANQVTYLPSNMVNSSRVTILGLLQKSKYVISVRTCRRPANTMESCSTTPARIELSVEDKDGSAQDRVFTALSSAPKEEFTKPRKWDRTGGQDAKGMENGKVNIITWFHILLGVAVFICMTLLFLFLGILLRRNSKRRTRKKRFDQTSTANETIYSTHLKGFYNSLEQLGLPVSAAFHQIVSIDRNAIEINLTLGNGRFGELFAGTFNSQYSGHPKSIARQSVLIPSEGQDNRLFVSSTPINPEQFQVPIESTSVFIRAVKFLRSNSTVSSPSLVHDELRSKLLASSHLANRIRHAHIVACYGMVKSTQPNLLVYERLQHGRLKEFLQKELHSIEEASPPSYVKSGLLSTRIVFQMLQQISSAFVFLSRQNIPGLIINSKSVMVGADFICKVEIQLWRKEGISSSRKLSADPFTISNLQRDISLFLEFGGNDTSEKKRNSKSQLANVLTVPSLTPLDLYRRILLAAIPPLAPDNMDDPHVQESTHVWYFGCLQLELLLASAFGQRFVLRKRISEDVDITSRAWSLKLNQLQRLSGAGSTMEYKLCETFDSSCGLTADWLRDILVIFISSWFSNDLLAQVLQASLSDAHQLRPKLSAIEGHLINYAAVEKQKQVARKLSRSERPLIAAIIHESVLVPCEKGIGQNTIGQNCLWNNFLQPDSPTMRSDLV